MKVIAMYSIKMRASHEDIHISGAETMCEFEDLENYLKKYSEYALNKGLEYIKNDITYTGAIILSAQTGQRLDSTEQRGIRVTHLAFKTCKRNGEISERVKDARALATCINAFEGVKAELCVSDDLHYTTGYYASPKLGYRRIFNIKEKGTRHGGRIIFVDEGINLNAYVSFLETVPKEIIEK